MFSFLLVEVLHAVSNIVTGTHAVNRLRNNISKFFELSKVMQAEEATYLFIRFKFLMCDEVILFITDV